MQEVFTFDSQKIEPPEPAPLNLSPFTVKICAMTVVFMDSRIARGIFCEVCDWTLLPGSSLEEHNSGLVHRTLLDALARLAPDKFLEFRNAVISRSRKKSKYALKRELRKAASQVSFFFFLTDIANTLFYFLKGFDPYLFSRRLH